MRRPLLLICFMLLLYTPSAAQTSSLTLILAPWSRLSEPKRIDMLDMTTGNTDTLLNLETDKAVFRLSPEGNVLAYTALNPTNPYDASLSVYHLQQRKLTITVPHVDTAGRVSTEPVVPSWSPDGQTVAVSAYTEEGRVIALVNKEAIMTLSVQHTLDDGTVEWSSDSQMLLYHSLDSLTAQYTPFVTLNIQDITTERIITSSSFARWIPNTHEVLTYQSTDEKNSIQLVRINAETGETTILSTPLAASALGHLIFKDQETLYLIEVVPTLHIDQLDLSTGAIQQVLLHEDATYYDKFLLSPDGQYLAARTFSENTFGDIHFYLLESGELVQRISNSDEKPLYDWIWQPNSSALIFCTGDTMGNYSTYRALLEGNSPDLISATVGGQILGWMLAEKL